MQKNNKPRVVVKVGTSTLTHPSGAPDLRSMERLVRALADVAADRSVKDFADWVAREIAK